MKIKIGYITILCLLAMMLGGCRGFKDVPLGDDVYKISGRASPFVSPERLQDNLLRHCAQLALDRGYRYFAILGGDMRSDDALIQTPATVNSSSTGYYAGNGYGSGNFSTNSQTAITPGSSVVLRSYRTTVIVKMFLHKQKNMQLFNAEIIYRALTPVVSKKLSRLERKRLALEKKASLKF